LWSPQVISQEIPSINIKNYSYIFGAHNYLSEKVLIGSSISEDEYIEAVGVVCEVFTSLRNDEDFAKIVAYFANHKFDEEMDKDVEEIITSFDAFINFIRIERDYLKENGSSEYSINRIASNIFNVRSELNRYKVTADEVLMALYAAQESVCAESRKLKEASEEKKENSAMWFSITNYAAMIGGAAVVLTDTIIATGSAGSVAPAALVSADAGYIIITFAAARQWSSTSP